MKSIRFWFLTVATLVLSSSIVFSQQRGQVEAGVAGGNRTVADYDIGLGAGAQDILAVANTKVFAFLLAIHGDEPTHHRGLFLLGEQARFAVVKDKAVNLLEQLEQLRLLRGDPQIHRVSDDEFGRRQRTEHLLPRGVSLRALLVPQRAVNELQGAYQIGVVTSDAKVDVRTVRAGEQVGDLWIIEEGLHPGEKVVVEGFARVRPGMVVRASPASDSSPASGTAPPAPAPSAGR